MRNDELLQGLIAAERDERRSRGDDATWAALAEGSLGEEELAALEARARKDPEIAAGLAIFRPLGPVTEESIVQSILATGPATRPAAKVVPLRAKALGRLGTIGAPLAVAAGVALWIGLRGERGAALPAYELTVMANAQADRAGEPRATAGEVNLHPHAFFEATARPAVPAEGPVEARAVLVRDGRAEPWRVPFQISDDGVVKVAGPAEKLFPSTAGSYEVVVALGRPGHLPSADALAACAEARGRCEDGVRRVRVVFVSE